MKTYCLTNTVTGETSSDFIALVCMAEDFNNTNVCYYMAERLSIEEIERIENLFYAD